MCKGCCLCLLFRHASLYLFILVVASKYSKVCVITSGWNSLIYFLQEYISNFFQSFFKKIFWFWTFNHLNHHHITSLIHHLILFTCFYEYLYIDVIKLNILKHPFTWASGFTFNTNNFVELAYKSSPYTLVLVIRCHFSNLKTWQAIEMYWSVRKNKFMKKSLWEATW